jgi:hypothetical protein
MGRGLPELKPPRFHVRRHQREIHAGREAEDAITGDFENPLAFMEPIVLLPAAFQSQNNARGI